MQFQVKGRNFEVSDSIRSYAEEKLGKLERQLTDPRVELEPHGIEDRERAGEAETQDPREVPHAILLGWRMSLSANRCPLRRDMR